MAIKRKQAGDAERYEGRRLHAEHVGPDLIGFVDDIELNGFYLSVEAALKAGRRYVDDQNKAAEQKGRS